MRVLVVLVAVGVAGCAPSEETPPDANGPSPPSGCQPGEKPRADGTCMAAGMREDGCPAGQHAAAGKCADAGIPASACGAGFTSDGAHGCLAVLPAMPCATGTFAVPGESACHEVAPCGTGTWGAIPADASTQYVDGAYQGGGSTGAADKPWTTIKEAVGVAAPGAIVAIAAGSYHEDVSVTKAVKLWGRCPAMVEIVGAELNGSAVIVAKAAGGTEVHGVALRGEGAGLTSLGADGVVLDRVWVHDTAIGGVNAYQGALTIKRSLVEHVRQFGVRGEGGKLVVESSAIVDTQRTVGDQKWGWGVESQSFDGEVSDITVRGSLVDGSRSLGMGIFGGMLLVEASVVRGTDADAQGHFGQGIALSVDAPTKGPPSAMIRASIVEGSHDAGVIAFGAKVELEHSVVKGTTPAPADPTRCYGVAFAYDPLTKKPAEGTVRESLVEGNAGAGVQFTGGTGTVRDSVVRGTTVIVSKGYFSAGVALRFDKVRAVATIDGSLIEKNPVGVYAQASDVTVLGAALNDQATEGVLAEASDKGMPSVTLRTSVLERNRAVGIFGDGAHTLIESSAIRDTMPSTDGDAGFGTYLVSGGLPTTVTMRWSVVEKSRVAGAVFGGVTLDMSAVAIRDTMARAADDFLGLGLYIEPDPKTFAPAHATVRATLIERSVDSGVSLIGSEAAFDGVVVRDSRAHEDGTYGDGIDVVESKATIDRMTVAGSARAGIANFGGTVSIATSKLDCNTFDLDGEVEQGVSATFDDRGGNTCGCGAEQRPCVVRSQMLKPPGG
jgi:hypothetical protein